MPKATTPPETPRVLVSDAEFETLKATLNNTIHELVFVVHHLENDDPETAAQCLMTAQSNLEAVAERVATLEEAHHG